jgi:hypothetical protein
MRLVATTFAVVGLCMAAATVAAADRADALSTARGLYNARQFEAAITAAAEAHSVAALADSADLIAARSYLERFRETESPDDLDSGRDRLRRLDPRRLTPRERVEYLVGLGEALYFEESYGAAAATFASAIARSDLGADGSDRVLDWWATAVDEEARQRPDIERQQIYQRLRERMQRELERRESATAAYWVAASARAQGDLQAAWDAALAAWVRATLAADGGRALRDDIDALMERAIVPERAKVTAQPPETLKAEWEAFKERWTREPATTPSLLSSSLRSRHRQ